MDRIQLSQNYSEIYNNGLNADEVTTVVKKENYRELKQRLSRILFSLGYTKVIFENPKQGFIVLAQEGDVHPSQIILKYTATEGEYKTRIELVKGNNDLSADNTVYEDIQVIAEQIENE